MKNEQPGKRPTQPFEDTPIYRKSEDILVNSHIIASRMSKQYKYGIGKVLCEKSIILAEAVAFAYIETENLEKKKILVKQIIRKAISALVTHRAANRLNTISRELYCQQVDSCVSIIKQAQGWLNKIAGNDRPEHSNGNDQAMASHHRGRTAQEVQGNDASNKARRRAL